MVGGLLVPESRKALDIKIIFATDTRSGNKRIGFERILKKINPETIANALNDSK